MNPYIIDTTLRDGEQAPGIAFTKKEKLRIAEYLNEIGVDEVETGTPAIGSEEQEAIRDIARSGFNFRTTCWSRAKKNDIVSASKLGTTAINISLPVSDIQIKALGKTAKWVLESAAAVTQVAKNYFEFVTVGAQDASRANNSFLKEFILHATQAGANRIRLSDTVGTLDPIQTFSLIMENKKCFPETEFEFHGHNDFGMATANTISALKAGAQCASVTVLGIGERAGNASLESVIAYLKYKHEITKYNTSVFQELCSYVASLSDNSIAKDKPIVGRNAFLHESGIHTAAMSKNIKTYQVLNPSDFGEQSTKYILGKHSGKYSIMYFLKQKGVEVDSKTASDFLLHLKKLSGCMNSRLFGADIITLYEKYLKTV